MLEGIQKFIIYLEGSSKLLQHDFSSDLTFCFFPSLIKNLASKRICQSAVNDFYIRENICTNKILYKITWHVAIIILFSFLADNQSYKFVGKHSLLGNFNFSVFVGSLLLTRYVNRYVKQNENIWNFISSLHQENVLLYPSALSLSLMKTITFFYPDLRKIHGFVLELLVWGLEKKTCKISPGKALHLQDKQHLNPFRSNVLFLYPNPWKPITHLHAPFSGGIDRSSPPEVFLGKGLLEICIKFTENPRRSVISMRLFCNFIEIAIRHRCSPVNSLHIFITPFSKNTSEGLPLHNNGALR